MFSFLRSGTINCEVTGSRQYSSDLEQGGLEIPCKLNFSCSDQERLSTTRKLLDLAFKKNVDSETSIKKIKLEPLEVSVAIDECSISEAIAKLEGDDQKWSRNLVLANLKSQDVETEWVKVGHVHLLSSHKERILNGEELDDMIINFAQKLLKKQFPHIDGLQNTVLQTKSQVNSSKQNQLQVIHSHKNHWIVASTVHDESNKVMVYNSLYNDIDADTKGVICNLFGAEAIPELVKVHKQCGVRDCGLFAVAFATAICFKQNLFVPFKQDLMRLHLIQCFDSGACLPFPLLHK